MTGKKTIVFNDFTKGEFGTLRPVEYGERGKTGLWTGTNIAILPDGSLCPQPEPKFQITSLAGAPATAVDFGAGYNGTGTVLWVKAGNKVSQSGTGPTFTFTDNTGTSADTVSYLDRVASGTDTFVITAGHVLEKINHSAGSTAAVAGAPAGNTVAQFNDRLMVGGTGANGNRLYFSAGGNFASWPAANFIDVGDSEPIVAIIPMRGFLAIAKAGGFDDTWWILRGTPGVNAVLRRASRFQGPGRPNNLALLNDNRLAFAVQNPSNGSTLNKVPAVFDGTNGSIDSAQIGHLSETLATETIRLGTANDLLIRNSGFMLMRHRGAWTRLSPDSLTDVPTSRFAASSRSMTADPTAGTVFLLGNNDLVYKWHPYATRPAFASDTDGKTPANTATFTLPEWRCGPGDEVAVEAVIVQFRRWDIGGGATNIFNLSVNSTAGYPSGGTVLVGGTSQQFAEATSAASTAGVPGRKTFTFTPVWGNGFQLSFGGIVGVAIESVTIIANVRPVQGVA